MAQSGHHETLNQCPLSGVKRTLVLHSAMSAFGPKQTCALIDCCFANLQFVDEVVE